MKAPIIDIRAVNSVRHEKRQKGHAIEDVAIWSHELQILREGGEWEPIKIVEPKAAEDE